MRVLAVVVALVVTFVGAPARAETGEDPADQAPTRILLLGDSVTQGSSGDWTWRYRLWQHLTASGASFDFVGPRDDLWDLRTGGPGASSYADPAFDRDHAARWGMWAGFLDEPVADLMADHQPDVLVVMLGVNDLIWSDDPPEAVAERMGAIVDTARASNPDVAVVLAEATQTSFPDVPAFNAALAAVAEGRSTGASPVVLADTTAGYDGAADTWDGSHPNARGEARIAAEVADALAVLGVGTPVPRPLVLPAVGPVTAPTLSGTAGNGFADLAWTGPDGATGHRLWARDRSVTTTWSLLAPELPRDGTHRADGLTNGHRYEFRLQPVKGDDEPERATYSNVVAAIPVAATAPPPALTAPARIRAAAGGRCVRLEWSRVAAVTGYRVDRWTGSRWLRAARTSRTRALLTSLPRQRAWTLRVRAERGATTGPARAIRVVRRSGGC